MRQWLQRLFGAPRKEPVPELVRQANSPDADTRRTAAERLSQVSEPWAAPALLGLLGDSHKTVRVAAADALRRLGPDGVSILHKGLEHATPEVARTSAELLGEAGSADSVGPLMVALKYGERPVQMEARRSLVKLGPASVSALESARSETHPWVRQQIEEILGAIQADTASRQTPA